MHLNQEEAYYISQLILKKINGSINSLELNELNSWIKKNPMNRDLYYKCISLKEQKEIYDQLQKIQVNNAWNSILPHLVVTPQQNSIFKNYRKLLPYLVAASILIVTSFILIFSNLKQDKNLRPEITKIDYHPAENKAVLKLSNGQELYLDSTKTEVQINDNYISYANGKKLINSSQIESAVIETPKGGYYKIILPDGTKAQLNAASSLSYPLKFTGNSREVSITGEVFFEVKKDNSRKFIVHTPNQSIEVLGTIFNVNSYNKHKIKTSLLEGKVSVKTKNNREDLPSILLPGHQSILENNKIKIKRININNEIAWVYGKFNFDNKNLIEVMGELERWYDIDIEIAPDVPNIEFFGGTYRNNNLSIILSLLEQNEITYILTDKKLIIKKSNTK